MLLKRERSVLGNYKKRLNFRYICCTIFLLTIAFSFPVHSQEYEWLRLFSTTKSEFGRDVWVDISGDIYITGITSGDLDEETNAGNDDVFLVKYDKSGEKLWATFRHYLFTAIKIGRTQGPPLQVCNRSLSSSFPRGPWEPGEILYT